MKKIILFILQSPKILFVITVDIIKLPIAIFIGAPVTFLFALTDFFSNDSDWFNAWKEFNISFMCLTYLLIKEKLN